MSDNHEDLQAVEQLKSAYEELTEQVGRVIVGQRDVVDQMLIAMLCSGHALLVGVPGLAKTLLVSTVARALDLSFNRIQFTPDLMPSDITGTEVLEEDQASGHKQFRFVRGPVFANVVLADEINRTPPKTQAALLQAMQEHEVTAGGETLPLGEPFFVLATQNPIEQEGTYPLPEAQLDRFMFNLWIDYPSEQEERDIVRSTTGVDDNDVRPVLDAARIVELQHLVRRVPAADQIIDYAVSLVRRTRPDHAPDDIGGLVSWGAGPRASQCLILGAKARALLQGRYTPSIDDVRHIAVAVLRHRIVTNFNAEAEGVSRVDIVERLLDSDR
ncbi:MAG: AAA family ATPase [Gemmatimonadetes bacterium]|nr:AAA family ATPase [Gemmatimonadota bacterium]|tara:strand:- start:333 stop:1319 length:987 start_codon:yes stop_codon:yes gene_type:complete